MKRINTAYALLRDPESRRRYDMLRAPHAAPSQATPRAPTAPRAQPNDPYTQMRAGYQQRVYRVQASTRALPAWAQALSGLFAGLGLVAGFLLGLPFGIVGCIPGAMVGMVVGMLVGLWAVYVLALGLPTALLGWLGLLLADTVGMWVGGGMGLALGMWWAPVAADARRGRAHRHRPRFGVAEILQLLARNRAARNLTQIWTPIVVRIHQAGTPPPIEPELGRFGGRQVAQVGRVHARIVIEHQNRMARLCQDYAQARLGIARQMVRHARRERRQHSRTHHRQREQLRNRHAP
jgi:hypothetical protein